MVAKDKKRKLRLSKNAIILIIVFAALIVFAAIAMLITRHSIKVPANPKGLIGNTGSNINNDGLFAERNGVVYFANSYDHGSLYKMNPDESGISKLLDGDVQMINAGEKHLYYYLKDSSTSSGLGFVMKVVGIYRCNLKGKEVETLTRDQALTILLMDDSLFFQHYDNEKGVSLYMMNTEGKGMHEISPDIINPASGHNGLIYYNDNTQSHFLYAMDINTQAMAEKVRYNMWNPVREGDYVYFMDMENDYRLCRYDLINNVIDVLSEDRLDTFNVCGNYVYYATSVGQNPALVRVGIDGSDMEVIAQGVFNHLNATSRYLYFQQFDDDFRTYHTMIGSSTYSEFNAANVLGNKAPVE